MHTLLRMVLILIGVAAILIGLFAPEKVQAVAAAWFAAP